MTSRRRVLLCAHEIHDGGGMERAFAELIRRAHRDVEFVVVAAALDERLRSLVIWRRVRVPMRPAPVRFVLFWILGGLAVRRLRGGALVHTLGAIVPGPADVVTIQFCHAGFLRTSGAQESRRSAVRRANSWLMRRLALLAERWVYRPGRVGRFAAVSSGVAREVSTEYPGIPTALTPNGVDVERFRPDAAVRAAMREQAGVADDETVLLFVGGDWDRKGLPVAVRGLGALRERGLRPRLWIVGPGDEARVRALAAEHGVADQLVFFGRRDDTERFFQAADIFVFPTAYETFSLVAYEAAASGLPVVAPTAHGIDDLLSAGGGMPITREPVSVAGAVEQLMLDAGKRRAIAADGKAFATGFDWQRSAVSVLRAYDAPR